MEQQTEQSAFNEELSPGVQAAITAIGKSAKLISVIGFALGAFVVAVFLFSGPAMFAAMEEAIPVEGIYPALVAAFFILFFVAAAVLYFLYKGSTSLLQGVQQHNNARIAEGFTFLKRFFIISAAISGLGVFINLLNLFN